MAADKIAIAYGSTTGTTEEAAELLLQELAGGEDPLDATVDLLEVPDLDWSALEGYGVWILGVPTWNIGQLQFDWEDRLEEMLEFLGDRDLSEVRVALYGCGDARGYPDTYQDALGLVWEHLAPRGATLIGLWPREGYDFVASKGLDPGGEHFLGLALDPDNEADLTEERVRRWAAQLKAELRLRKR